MKRPWCLAGLLALALLAAAATAQQPDYLTPEEVEKVREAQDPNKRIQLFLQFARERLLSFEQALAPAPDQEPPRPDALRDLLNDFIRAVDDTYEAVDLPLQRGGADLTKSRSQVMKDGEDFLKRLEQVGQSSAAQGDLVYDLEDAVEATQELVELAKKVPTGPIPSKMPGVTGEAASEKREPPPGQPTLKRKRDEKPKPK